MRKGVKNLQFLHSLIGFTVNSISMDNNNIESIFILYN
jgi:hypothetical protein